MEDYKSLEFFRNAQESLVVQQSDFSLKTIADMVNDKAIDIAPRYQRRERWHPDKQSGLVESFILNVPVPPVYLSEDDYGKYSVIDGKQRITTIWRFINNEFKLTNLRKFPELNGMYFKDLNINIKNALSIRPYLRVVTLLRQSDPSLKYEVFLRLNTGGEKLKPQEIRNVAYSGPLNDLLYELSDNIFLRKKLKIVDERSTAYRNMDDLELILRFFTVYEQWQKIGGNLSLEMDRYMALNRKASLEKINNLREAFNTAINSCEKIWGPLAFNKPIVNGWRGQIISPLYDAQMVSMTMLSEKQKTSLEKKGGVVLDRLKKMFIEDAEFENAVSQATNNSANIKLRINRMRYMLETISGE